MLETEKVDDLFCKLKEMTRPVSSHSKAAPLLTMEHLLKFFLIGILPLVFTSVWLRIRWKSLGFTPSEVYDVLFVTEWLLIVLLFFFLLTLIVTILYIAWHRELVPYLFPSVENARHRDAKFTAQLLMFNKAKLAYGLLQYRQRWLSRERFVAILVGDFRKLGLLPALATLFISVATLFKGDSSPLLLLLGDFIVILVFFYLTAFVAVSRERPQEVIKLLEYAIQHANQCNPTPPAEKTT
jgi:hypothetical protein